MDNFHGACLCGEVRFEYQPPGLWCAHCHCSLCQRAHGAPLVTWVGVAEEQFRFTSDSALRWYRSSADSERGFCSHCGTTLFFRSQRWAGQMHIVRTNIHGDIDTGPSAHVHCESQASWFPFTDALPRERD
ncbi:MAG: GFA family protein [Halioglobus sp.]|nr:GFA family protein [Halioglobus sp.]